MGLCYDIKTSLYFFKKLLDEREDFLKSPNSARHEINCASEICSTKPVSDFPA